MCCNLIATPAHSSRDGRGKASSRCRERKPQISVTRVRTALPSRPGELHPRPLTEPDVSLSARPARAIQPMA
jgi:hypothetical protein